MSVVNSQGGDRSSDLRIVVEHQDGTVSLLSCYPLVDGPIRAERPGDVFADEPRPLVFGKREGQR